MLISYESQQDTGVFAGPHTMSLPWSYQLGSVGTEITGCLTKFIVDDNGNKEVSL